jgi:hypothetical protein
MKGSTMTTPTPTDYPSARRPAGSPPPSPAPPQPSPATPIDALLMAIDAVFASLSDAEFGALVVRTRGTR